MTLNSINPINGETLQTYDYHTAHDVEHILSRSATAAAINRKRDIAARATMITRVADYLDSNVEACAKLMTLEMGKPIAQARGEVKKCAALCRYYVENAEDFLADKPLSHDDYKTAYMRYLPIGTVLGVMPWNFPFWQAFRYAVPSLLAGNVVLLKHASNVPQCAIKIEEIFMAAGFDNGAFQLLKVSSDIIEGIIADPRVHAVTLTGSEKAGATVASHAARHIKKSVLELGGSDPLIIMPSATIEQAVQAAVQGRIINNGETCIAAKRFIIHADIYDEVKDKLIAQFDALKTGDPMDEDTDIGPLAMPQIRDDLDAQVQETIAKGATRLCGAEVIKGAGNFYQAGLLENIPKDSPAYYDELFGPVGLLFKVHSMAEAIALANDVRFGLGSSLFTQDDAEIEAAVDGIDAGMTFVNSMVGSAPSLPFGGTKASGYGRELAEEGMREFVNAKTIAIKS